MTSTELSWQSQEIKDACIIMAFQFVGSEHVWFEYFPPTDMWDRPSLGNNPQEAAQNVGRARSAADAWKAAFTHRIAKCWEVKP